jgi:Spy/CpxP family protein refolding chaperone
MRAKQIVATGGIALALLLAASRAAVAQNPGPGPGPGEDPLARFLFPPELVMSHQQAIGLSERQRSAIQQELQKAQGKFSDLQWRMSSDAEKMTHLLQATPVDEAQVLDQVDKILNTERDVKKTQITLLVRIKNTLTPEQQAKLNEMRRQGMAERGMGAPGMPPG